MISKSGARDIILSQIKQDFVTPANAIFDYLDIVEKASPEEYSELRHNLRTPLNAIIGYGEILIEDFEEDLPESRTRRIIINDLKHIIDLARSTEKAIETFVDFIRGEDVEMEDASSSNIESAEALFKSLGDIEYSISLSENLELHMMVRLRLQKLRKKRLT